VDGDRALRRESRQMGITLGQHPAGLARRDLDGKAPTKAQWKSHNYNHLMEQPTIFYAIALTLALMGIGGGINYWLAWGYVGFRIVHSLVQCDGQHRRAIRFPLFRAGPLCLLGLTVHAGARILHDCGMI
jgi:hypothetical protein